MTPDCRDCSSRFMCDLSQPEKMANIVDFGREGHLRCPEVPGTKDIGDFIGLPNVPPDHDLDEDLPGASVEAPSRKDFPSNQKKSSRGIGKGARPGQKDPGDGPCHEAHELSVEKEPPVASSGDKPGGSDQIRSSLSQ